MDSLAWPAHVTVPIALLLAGVMGLALQRGATCTVAALAELVTERQAARLLALVETAVWIAGGLLLLRALGLGDVLADLAR